MAYYWVNLGISLKEVHQDKFLWAPAYTYTGNGKKTVKAGWKHVPNVKQGDVIICHENKQVLFLARALSDSYPAPRPENRKFDEWKKEGYRIDIKLFELEKPIPNVVFKNDIIGRFNELCDPKLFNSKGNATQSYMYSIPESVAAIVLNCIGDNALPFFDSLDKEKQKGKRKNKKGSEKEAYVKTRVGQAEFRQDVLDMWNNTCPVTRVNIPELLIASHILPWSISNGEEKTDPYNGLPLSPHIDKLFDKGFISFTDDGSMLRSDTLPKEILSALGITQDMKIKGLQEEHCRYLKRHREIFGFI